MDEAAIANALGAWGAETGPLYVTLANALDELIRAGRLDVGTPLPAERKLASALHVSRGTVVAAYGDLRKRGRLTTRQGSGTVVSGEHDRDAMSRFDPVPGHGGIFDGILDNEHPVDEVIDLRSAYWIGVDDLPDDSFELPPAEWRMALRGTGYHPSGYPPLRDAIAARLSRLGLTTTPDQVLVTNGAQQALALTAQVFLAPNDLCVVEELTYPGIIGLVRALRGRLHTTPIDSGGVDVELLDRAVRRVSPELVYLMPNIQNPTGVLFSEERRRELGRRVAAWDSIVIDDRTLVELTIDGAVPLPLGAAPDESLDNVITVGSTSKSLWGGLRVGWIRADVDHVDRLSRLKVLMDLGIPIASQMIATKLLPLSEGLSSQRRFELRRRRDAFVGALNEYLPEWTFNVPDGGLCLWVKLPMDDVRRFLPYAARQGVGLAPGDVSSPDGGARDHLRLPFGHCAEDLIDAVERLALAWADLQQRPVRTSRVGVIV